MVQLWRPFSVLLVTFLAATVYRTRWSLYTQDSVSLQPRSQIVEVGGLSIPAKLTMLIDNSQKDEVIADAGLARYDTRDFDFCHTVSDFT